MTALPVPAGSGGVVVTGEATDALVVGYATINRVTRGVIWRNGVPEVMPEFADGSENLPQDINSSGVVVGFRRTTTSTSPWQYVDRAYRYQDGVYHFLPGYASKIVASRAVAINEAGDVVGIVKPYTDTGAAYTKSVFWPASAPNTFQVIDAYSAHDDAPLGIDDQGRVLFRDVLWGPNQIDLPLSGTRDGAAARVYSAGRIVGWQQGDDDTMHVVEWDQSGEISRVLPGDGYPCLRYRPALWRDGQFAGFISDPRPDIIVGLTDDEVVIGDYVANTTTGTRVPALWRCS